MPGGRELAHVQPCGDTASKPAITVGLTPGWKKYTINLNGAGLRRVVGAFG
jgi:hypothetical protein